MNYTQYIFVFYLVKSKKFFYLVNLVSYVGFFLKYPTTSDSKFDASLPEGSIAPYSRSQTLIQVFYFN